MTAGTVITMQTTFLFKTIQILVIFYLYMVIFPVSANALYGFYYQALGDIDYQARQL